MLKLKINTNEFISDLIPIQCSSIESEEMLFTDGDVTYEPNFEKNIVTCYHDGLVKIKNGDTIVSVYHQEDSDGNLQTFQQDNIVLNADADEHFFTIMSDRYLDLDGETFSYERTVSYDESTDEYSENDYIYLNLDRYHFWANTSYPIGVDVYLTNIDGAQFNLVAEPFGDKCIRFPLTEMPLPDCNGIDGDEMDFCEELSKTAKAYNDGVKNNRLMAIMLFEYYGLLDRNDSEWTEISERLFSDNTPSEVYSARPFRFKQYNFMFEDTADINSRTINLVRPNVSISIPLKSKNATDLNQETNVNEKFVEVESRKAVKPYLEMEKDVYSPVIKIGNDESFKRVTEVRFNLHFRKRFGNEWKVDRDGYWNGVKMENGNAVLMGASNEDTYGFFSYKEDKSSQSDLLYYLGFSDSDVKYRKNTLKKSFLRLSFFDSTIPTRQNLLTYSTVFVDTGNLFSIYTKNFGNPKNPNNRFAFSRIMPNDENGATKKNLSGCRVNREPYWQTYPSDVSDIEAFRLSSQFVVKDKYSSNSCSEGFYLYLWKDYNNGNTPTDIYMRVEFNHAGFGRTIPFMMPYDSSNKKIKKFEEIINDFNSGNGYSIDDYIKYSYVHFKYLTSSNGMHVYYLDYPEDDINFNGGVLSLNLYEAKLIDWADESD